MIRAGRRIRPVRHVARHLSGVVIMALVTTASGPAAAFDWSLSSLFSERVEVDDNVRMEPDPPGSVIGSTTQARVAAEGKAPTASMSFLADVGYTLFRGIDGGPDSDNGSMLFETTFKRQRRLVDYTLEGSFSRQSTLFSEETDTGQTQSNANRLTYRAATSATHRINHTDTVSLGGSATHVTFDKDVASLNPYNSFTLTNQWARQLTRTSTGAIVFNATFFEPERAGGTSSQSYSATSRFSHQFDDVWSMSSGIGISYTTSDSASNGSVDGFGFPLDLSFQYRGALTSYSFNASHRIAPSASGSVQASTSIGVATRHQIDHVSGVGFSAGFTHQDNPNIASTGTAADPGKDRVTFSVSPTYFIRLTPEWTFDLGYQYRLQDSSSGFAESNKAFVKLSHEFEVIP